MGASKKERINFVISTLSGGGAQRVVSVLSFGLSSKYDVNITLHDSRNINYPYQGNLVDLGIPVDRSLIKKLYNAIRRVQALRKAKRSLKAKATISFMESSNFVNILSGKIGRTIISVRSYMSNNKSSIIGRVFSSLIKQLYNRSDSIVAASYGIKQDLVLNFGVNKDIVKVIYNPYDIKEIIACANENIEVNYNEIFSKPVIVTSGRLSKQKGQWHLIRAFKEIKRAIPEAMLVILGNGELHSALHDYALKTGLEKFVFLLGFKSNPHKYVANSDVFVLPSLVEGFPNALVEAMACGVPVVSSDCRSGPREILAPATYFSDQTKEIELAEYGILTPICSGKFIDPEAPLLREELLLANAVTMLLNSKELANKYREKSMERVRDFDVNIIAEQWVKLIDS